MTLTETPIVEAVEAPVKAKRTVKPKAVKKLPKLICKTKGCRKEVVRTGTRGRPPFNCPEHRATPAAE